MSTAVRFDRSKLNAIAKAKKLFVSETCLRLCALDLQISFLALAIASNKKSKTISETHAKWSRFGTVNETQGLAEENKSQKLFLTIIRFADMAVSDNE